jgi:hypothetical protein
LVIRYSYLWRSEALRGREEGVKDRPCAIIVAAKMENDGRRVLVLPITHRPPNTPGHAIEIPAAVKVRLGLDERSWIVLIEVNAFSWPGPDLRPLPNIGPDSVALGFLPPAFFRVVRDRVAGLVRAGRFAQVGRTE